MSKDTGIAWEKTSASEEMKWSSIACNSTGAKVYASAGAAGVYISDDFGRSFEKADGTDVSGNWQAVATDSTGQYAYALDLDDTSFVIRTSDGGVTWLQVQIPSMYENLFGAKAVTVSADGMHVAISFENALILVSNDYGKNFDTGFFPGGEYSQFFRWNALASSYSGQYVFGSSEIPNAEIQKNSNYGGTSTKEWIPLEETKGYQWIDIACDSSGQILFGTTEGANGFIFQSVDGGITWSAVDGGDILLPQSYTSVATSSCGALTFATTENGIYTGVIDTNSVPTSVQL